MNWIFYDFRRERILRSNLLHRRAMWKRMMDDSMVDIYGVFYYELSVCVNCQNYNDYYSHTLQNIDQTDFRWRSYRLHWIKFHIKMEYF